MVTTKLWTYLIPLSLFIFAASVFYYLVIYSPIVHKEAQEAKEKAENEKKAQQLTQLKNYCLNQYSDFYAANEKNVNQLLEGTCGTIGICTYEQFLASRIKDNNPFPDFKSSEFAKNYINNCMVQYGPVGQ